MATPPHPPEPRSAPKAGSAPEAEAEAGTGTPAPAASPSSSSSPSTPYFASPTLAPAHFTSRAHSFNAAAASYAAHRPSYPPALLDAVEELAGRPLSGARVADIGAGTGIGTAVLVAHGARPIAVEPGDGMAAEFRRTLPDVPLVRGDGNHLPLATASADFITYAQAWHWTDAALSAPEAMRVLRPGGALALWWNVMDDTVQWVADQDTRLRTFFADTPSADPEPSTPTQPSTEAEPGTPTPMSAHGNMKNRISHNTGGLNFLSRKVPWSRRISIEEHLANLGTHSAFLIHDPESTDRFFAKERAELLNAFPDGWLEEPYVVELHVARAPH
ncbi:class I SAM-dependent methyltransferase [Streptomyces sp. NPDC048442]|uniref:class I SAM-dependent methyltransferase n=1 Tax=Streptomyces sp. NPDC048442 TaxID=3154823 RepID=UPI00344A207D